MVSRRVTTTVRCVPRYGYADTEVRTIEIGVQRNVDESSLYTELTSWFEAHGIDDAVFDVAVDTDGYFAIVNDEAFAEKWGDPLL